MQGTAAPKRARQTHIFISKFKFLQEKQSILIGKVWQNLSAGSFSAEWH